MLEGEPEPLYSDETSMFEAENILVLVELSSALENAKESWLSPSTQWWVKSM